jgi:hypothetical protein
VTTEWISAVAAVVGAPLAAAALLVGARQLVRGRRASEAQFLLSLDDAFRHHVDTHMKFRPASTEPPDVVGGWCGPEAIGPETDEDLADVEAYMGLFERVNVMIDRGLIDADVVDRLYGYRVGNLLSNPRVVDAKLRDQAAGWQEFIALAAKLEYEIPPPSRRAAGN